MIDHEDDMSGTDRSKVDCCILKTVNSIEKKLSCNSAIAFGSAEINRQGGYVITEPGLYCLKEDVVFNPAAATVAPPNPAAVQAAITIKSSDVFLDLGAHTLSQAGAGTTTQVPYVIGILVPDALPDSTDINAVGYQSIYIKGGDPAIIDGFSMYGIRIFAHTFDIRLTNLTVKNCGLLAQKNLPRPTVYGFEYIPHSNQFTPGLGSSFGVGGIAIGEGSGYGMGPRFFVDVPLSVPNNRTKEVFINNVSCLNNYLTGIYVVCMNNLFMDESHFDYTFADDPGRAATPGFPAYNGLSVNGITNVSGDGGIFGAANNNDDPFIDGMWVNNCTFNYTQLKGDFTTPFIGTLIPCNGGLIVYVNNYSFTNSQFCHTYNNFVTTTAFTTGCLFARGNGGLFQDCSFDDVTSIGSANGFHISGTSNILPPTKSSKNTKVINCSASNVKSIGDQQLPAPTLSSTSAAVGFSCSFARNLTFENCESQDISISGPANNNAIGRAVGFTMNATSNVPTDPDGATAENVVYRNCVASRCSTLNGGSAIGFRFVTTINTLTDALQSVTVQNCVSTDSNTFVPTLTTPGIVQGSSFGFYVLQQNQPGPERFISYPILFDSCKAMHNKGLPSSNTLTAAVNPVYSAGFYLWNAQRHALVNCDAIDNVYGIFLNTCDRCTVRDCRSDNNLDLIYTPGTGEGYTSIAAGGTPAAPGVTNSTFENNRAFRNGAGTIHDGTNGNYNIIYNAVGPVREALLAGSISTLNSFAPTASQPTYFANLHNISTIG